MKIKFPEIIVKALAAADAALAGEVYQAIMAYALQGAEPTDLSSAAQAIFILAKEMITPAGAKPKPRKPKAQSKQEPIAAEVAPAPTPEPAPQPTADISPRPYTDMAYPRLTRPVSGKRRQKPGDWILRERRNTAKMMRMLQKEAKNKKNEPRNIYDVHHGPDPMLRPLPEPDPFPVVLPYPEDFLETFPY